MTELYEHLEEKDDDASSVTEEWEVFKRMGQGQFSFLLSHADVLRASIHVKTCWNA